MNKIGGSTRVRDELTMAMADGRGVTAKVRWISRADEEGRNRWIHCTPLIGSNGQIGVWMVVIIDDDSETIPRRWRQAPPVLPVISTVTRKEGGATSAFDEVASSYGVAFDDNLRSDRPLRPTRAFQHPVFQASPSASESSLIL
jgi:hypothetical protein